MTGSQALLFLPWDALPGMGSLGSSGYSPGCPVCLQDCWSQGREWEGILALWEVWKTAQTGDAKEGAEPRPPTVLCQVPGLHVNLAGQPCLSIAS